jgi:hypothetical protein
MVHFKELAEESVVGILEYLRAMDLANVSEVDKTLFHKSRVSRAIKYQMENIYTAVSTPVKDKKDFYSPMKDKREKICIVSPECPTSIRSTESFKYVSFYCFIKYTYKETVYMIRWINFDY